MEHHEDYRFGGPVARSGGDFRCNDRRKVDGSSRHKFNERNRKEKFGGQKPGEGRGQGASRGDVVRYPPGKITVSSNQWKIILPKKPLLLFRSEVLIKNVKMEMFSPDRETKWEIFNILLEKKKIPESEMLVYDGESILISRTPVSFPQSVLEFSNRTYSVEVIHSGLSVDLSKLLDKDADISAGYTAVNLVLIAAARYHNLYLNSRKFVLSSPSPDDLKPMRSLRGCSIIFGHMQALYSLVKCTILDPPVYRPFDNFFQKRESRYLSLALNPSCAVFVERQPLSQYCNTKYGINLLKGIDFKENALKFYDIKGLKAETFHVLDPVTFTPSRRTFKIDSFVFDKSAATHKITYNEKSIPLNSYFQLRYNIILKHPRAPLVQMKPAKREIFLPIELVYISHQRIKNLSDDSVKAEIAESLIMGPGSRIEYTQKKRKLFDGNPVLKHYGLGLAKVPDTYNAVVLTPPKLQYAHNMHEPANGSWNLQNKQFLIPKALNSICIVACIDGKSSNVSTFCTEFLRTAKDLGINGNLKYDIIWQNLRNLSSLKNTINSRKPAPQFLLFVIPHRNTETYAMLKNMFAGFIPSGCIVAERTPVINPRKRSSCGHYANILCKLNKKLGGVNHSIKLKDSSLERLMGSDESLAIVSFSKVELGCCTQRRNEWKATTCCLIMSFDNYHSFTQEGWLDMANVVGSAGFCDAFSRCLKKLSGSNHAKWPKRIVMFCEGIPESLLLTFTESWEAAAIKKLYKDKGLPEPLITIIAFYRTHALRFFAQFSTASPAANIPPGTTIYDSCIAEGQFPNFFLVPHSGIKGTSRCPRYYIIHDDISPAKNLNLFFWIMFCFEQCYLYEVCQRAVSCVASSFYAKKFLDRVYIHIKQLVTSLMADIDRRSISWTPETEESIRAELDKFIPRKIKEINTHLDRINQASTAHYFI